MKGSNWVKLGIFFLLIGGVGWALKLLGVDLSALSPEKIRQTILAFGPWAPVVYLLAYGQPLVPLPASLMTAVGGAAFGKGWGFLAALSGATSRACTQFLVARLLGRDAVSRLLKGQVAQLDQRIGERGFKAVLLIRLIPNLPFDVQNYGLGFSKVRFGPYVLATFLGIIPGSFAFVYLGYSLTDPKQIWKLALAVLLIVGLMLIQRAWTAKRAPSAQ